MNSTMDSLKNEEHGITSRRVILLENLLDQALEVIALYAKESWVDKAESYYFTLCDDARLSRQFAYDSWNNGQSGAEVNFGYPVPIELHTDIVESEVSYFSE